jgi:hypothetical protein
MKLRNWFWIGLAVWVVGGFLRSQIVINVVGSSTILLGLFLLGRWGWRKLSGAGPHRDQNAATAARTNMPSGHGMSIFSALSVPEEARDVIERAIQHDNFKPKGRTEAGWELLYVQTPTQDWLAVVEVTDAIMVMSAFKTTAGAVDQHATEYLAMEL